MHIKNLNKRTDKGYTFSLKLGCLWVSGWWYNTDWNNVVPPSNYRDGKRYPFVHGYGAVFKGIRDMVALMLKNNIAEYNSDSFLFTPVNGSEISEAEKIPDVHIPEEDLETGDGASGEDWQSYLTRKG